MPLKEILCVSRASRQPRGMVGNLHSSENSLLSLGVMPKQSCIPLPAISEPALPTRLLFPHLTKLQLVAFAQDWAAAFMSARATPTLRHLGIIGLCALTQEGVTYHPFNVEGDVLTSRPELRQLDLKRCHLVPRGENIWHGGPPPEFHLRNLSIIDCFQKEDPYALEVAIHGMLVYLPHLQPLMVEDYCPDHPDSPASLLKAILELPDNGQVSPVVKIQFWVRRPLPDPAFTFTVDDWTLFPNLEDLDIDHSWISLLNTALPRNMRELKIRASIRTLPFDWITDLPPYFARDNWRGTNLKLVEMTIVKEGGERNVNVRGPRVVKSCQEAFENVVKENGKQWVGFPHWTFKAMKY